MVLPRDACASDMMSNPDWYIALWDSGYSDWMISPHGHEQLSGEWAAAVRYGGIAKGESMWLERNWVCPDWTSNSQFVTVTPFQSHDDPGNPVVGKDTGRGVIANGQLRITIDASMQPGRTVAGLSPASPAHTLTHWYPMIQTYTLTNTTDQVLSDVALFQFMQAHPNDDYGPNNYGVYDPTMYADASDAFGAYHHDMSFFAPLSTWQADMDDIIGFSSITEPTEWGLGQFSGHDGEPGLDSLHNLVETDLLPGGIHVGPTEIAGAMKWDFGNLAPSESIQHSVLFYTAHTEGGVTPRVPAPGAVVLAAIGGGVTAWLRRRRML
jgi:hypothetical protein